MTDQLVSEAASIITIADFKQWIRNFIQPLYHHAAIYCGYGRVHAGGVGLDYVITDNFPVEHLDNIRNKAGGMDSPILRRWIATQQPQFFSIDEPWADIPPAWFQHFRNTGLKNIASHGVFDTVRCVGTYFSFFDVGRPFSEEDAELLKYLCPIIHEAMCDAIDRLNDVSKIEASLDSLTKREREIADHIGLGKTNREISEALCLSEITVKHHLMKIFTKFEVSTRAQLAGLLAEYRAKLKPDCEFKLL
ncbi:LuxR family transcriptional regulator [Undibacterium sp. TS12]|uniref:helix-turn-helix transcriptional regulator n=1 Tax=Undibacterium sp. TS12 TaxID=2908202 RepID=UPI001F4C595F|nr:LuxR family transcriptional regulator [Undibacterium sp. TS12]MCH8620355.1 LuxR C-terminal-related transcriptional regulator [Undibacterium sp. TS12]